MRVEAGSGLAQAKAAVRACEESMHELRSAVDLQSTAISRLVEMQRTLEDVHGAARDLQQHVSQLQEESGAHAGELDKLNSTTGAHQLTLRDMLAATEAASAQIDALQVSHMHNAQRV